MGRLTAERTRSGPRLLRRELAVPTVSSRQEKPGSAGALRGSPEALRSHLKVPEGGMASRLGRAAASIRSSANRLAARAAARAVGSLRSDHRDKQTVAFPLPLPV